MLWKYKYNIAIPIVTILYWYIIMLTEKPTYPRKLIITGIIVVIGSVFLLDYNKKHNKILASITTIIALIGVVSLEYFSKFSLNYMIIPLYFIIILDIGIKFKGKTQLLFFVIAIVSSISKFVVIFRYNYNYFNISQFTYLLILEVFFALIAYYMMSYKDTKEKQEMLLQELKLANIKLIDYSEELETLTKVKERSLISAELHDTLGHNLTAMIMQLEMAERYIKKESYKESIDMIASCKGDARENLKEIRAVVESIAEPNKQISFQEIIAMIDNFSKKTGTIIELENNVKDEMLFDRYGNVIYKIFRESITNAVRHAKASRIDIALSGDLEIVIRNDGIIKTDIVEGFGLKKLRESVESCGGEIYFTAQNEFITTVKFFA